MAIQTDVTCSAALAYKDISDASPTPEDSTYYYRQEDQTNERLGDVVSLSSFFNGSHHCVELDEEFDYLY